jgi:hydrogenase-4 component B
MNSIGLLLTAIGTLSVSGVPLLFTPRQSLAGQRLAVALMVIGSGLGLWATGQALSAAAPPAFDTTWFLPIGRFSIVVDPISAFFLIPVFLVPALGAIYGLGYWKQSEHPDTGGQLALFYGLLAGAMALVVIAHDAVLFLLAWEVMALAAYFAATAENDDPAVQRAGWIYLVATHAGTLCLFALFALMRHVSGSFAFEPLKNLSTSPALLTALFLLAVVGFGFKAGLMPVHVWLPEAHANAPSHVSAVMSGVMLKMGVYGIVRMVTLLPHPPVWWGGLLLGLGTLTGVAGIAFAIGQQDLKRSLAYSSIENIGIIAMGLGLALIGRSAGRMDWVVLGLGGALLHVWNHSLFKSLLFLNSGAIIHATHTREIDRMGGLAKQMPRTAFLFALGAVAICGLPPLNGFASEWLLYVGLFRTVSPAEAGPACPVAALCAALLAMIGALAAVCFLKLFGTMFLGESRSDATARAHDPGASLLLPMGTLAAGCAVVGLGPWLAAPLLDRTVAVWNGLPSSPLEPIRTLAPMGWISVMGGILILTTLLFRAILGVLRKTRTVETTGTWDCGYAQPTARMQYTGSSFGQTLVGLFAWFLFPKSHPPRLKGLFPDRTAFRSQVPDAILDRLILPLFRFAGRYLSRLRQVEQSRIQISLLYFLAAVLILLVWGKLGF